MAAPKKPIFSETKKPTPGAKRYRIKEGAPPHYLWGDLHKEGAIVTLPEGCTPGRWLEEVDNTGKPVKGEAGVKSDAKPDEK